MSPNEYYLRFNNNNYVKNDIHGLFSIKYLKIFGILNHRLQTIDFSAA